MNPYLAIIITNLIWGAAPPIFKYALTEIPPFTLAFIRFFFAGLIFLPFYVVRFKLMSRSALKSIWWGSLWGIIINISFFFIGLQLAPSINVHVLSSVGPIVLYLLSLVMLHERPHGSVIKGILVSFAGLLVIIFGPLIWNNGQSTNGGYSTFSQIIGNLFFFISMVGAVLNTIYNKKALKEVDPYVLTCLSFMIAAVAFFPFMLYEQTTWSFDQLESKSWTGIIFGVFFSSAVAYFFHNYSISKLPAHKIGVFTYLEPVVAVIVAIPLLAEYPDVFFVLGSVLVFAGIFVSNRHPHYKQVHKKFD